MKLSFLKRLKKTGEKPKAATTEIDLARLKIQPAEPVAKTPNVEPDMQAWMDRDLQALSLAWDVFSEDPSRQHWQELAKTTHNLHGASGAYGGGALTRLTENLQRILIDHIRAADNRALINLHVQACKAWAIGNEEARTTLADAVCDSLERQVRQAL